MAKKLKNGYTLVELLIVILIIAIMTSVLIPTFSQRTTLADVKLSAESTRSAILNAQLLALTNTRKQLLSSVVDGCEIQANEINYVLVTFYGYPVQYQIKIASTANQAGISNSCGIETKKQLPSKVKLSGNIPVIFFEVGTSKMQTLPPLEVSQKEVFMTLQAANDPSKEVKIITSTTTGQVRIE